MNAAELQSLKRSIAIFMFFFAIEAVLALLGPFLILDFSSSNVDKVLMGEHVEARQVSNRVTILLAILPFAAYVMGGINGWLLGLVFIPPSQHFWRQLTKVISVGSVALGVVVGSTGYCFWIFENFESERRIFAMMLLAVIFFYNIMVQLYLLLVGVAGWRYRTMPRILVVWTLGVLAVASLFNFVIYDPPTPSYPLITASFMQAINGVGISAYLLLDSLRSPEINSEQETVIVVGAA